MYKIFSYSKSFPSWWAVTACGLAWGSIDGHDIALHNLHYFDVQAMLSENNRSERLRVLCTRESWVLWFALSLLDLFISSQYMFLVGMSVLIQFFFLLVMVWTYVKNAWPDWKFVSVTHVVFITLLHCRRERFSGQGMARSERQQPLRAETPRLCHGRTAADVDIWW